MSFMLEDPKAAEGAVAAQPPRAPQVTGEPRSKARMSGGCLRADCLAKREKAAEVDKAEVEKSTSAPQIKLSAPLNAAMKNNIKILDAPREWREKFEEMIKPSAPPPEQRIDERFDAIETAAAD